jgi:hypothetical protein
VTARQQADATRGAAGATPEVRVALRRQPGGDETQVLSPTVDDADTGADTPYRGLGSPATKLRY